MASIFTKIINREIPGHFLYEDELCVVILDKCPTVKGQSLVIPKVDVDYVLDLEEAIYLHCMNVARKIARASDQALATERSCFVIEGFDVPHVHIKIFPMQDTDRPLGKAMGQPTEASDEALSQVATQIIAALEDE